MYIHILTTSCNIVDMYIPTERMYVHVYTCTYIYTIYVRMYQYLCVTSTVCVQIALIMKSRPVYFDTYTQYIHHECVSLVQVVRKCNAHTTQQIRRFMVSKYFTIPQDGF